MKINLFLFILFFPFLLVSQSLRDSKQKFITISKESIINNEANLFTFSLDFKHETPFHCASIAWTENHEGEKPNSHFLFSFSYSAGVSVASATGASVASAATSATTSGVSSVAATASAGAS